MNIMTKIIITGSSEFGMVAWTDRNILLDENGRTILMSTLFMKVIVQVDPYTNLKNKL
jgi:hypothetical protein